MSLRPLPPGFDGSDPRQVLAERVRRMESWLAGRRVFFCPDEPFEPGSPGHKEYAAELYRQVLAESEASGVAFNGNLTPELVGAEGRRVEAVTRDGEVVRFWVRRAVSPASGFPRHEVSFRCNAKAWKAAAWSYRSVRVIGLPKSPANVAFEKGTLP